MLQASDSVSPMQAVAMQKYCKVDMKHEDIAFTQVVSTALNNKMHMYRSAFMAI